MLFTVKQYPDEARNLIFFNRGDVPSFGKELSTIGIFSQSKKDALFFKYMTDDRVPSGAIFLSQIQMNDLGVKPETVISALPWNQHTLAPVPTIGSISIILQVSEDTERVSLATLGVICKRLRESFHNLVVKNSQTLHFNYGGCSGGKIMGMIHDVYPHIDQGILGTHTEITFYLEVEKDNYTYVCIDNLPSVVDEENQKFILVPRKK